MAEQLEPVQRRVAVKIIKPGMDSRQVIGRFEAERQALALMDHPNIAKVLDAGTTSAGRPFVVMELVRGLPITQYCNEQRLSTQERASLLLGLCVAVVSFFSASVRHDDLRKIGNMLPTCSWHTRPWIAMMCRTRYTSSNGTSRAEVTWTDEGGLGAISGSRVIESWGVLQAAKAVR